MEQTDEDKDKDTRNNEGRWELGMAKHGVLVRDCQWDGYGALGERVPSNYRAQRKFVSFHSYEPCLDVN